MSCVFNIVPKNIGFDKLVSPPVAPIAEHWGPPFGGFYGHVR
jgi:hypothetical protein